MTNSLLTIDELNNLIIKKYKDISDIKKQIDQIEKDTLNFKFGSIVERSCYCPYEGFESEYYLITKTKDGKVCLINCDTWICARVVESLDKLREIAKDDTYEWELTSTQVSW